jgi:UDP-GlcNAc:undecaprenyl-phosphate GlcNAc-1-phosphate transferase
VLLPLADCVSLMARRIRAGRSPFAPDREHIHHYLLARGIGHSEALIILLMVSLMFGAIGFFGWRWGVAEPVLFWGFFLSFLAYHFWIGQQWRRLTSMGGAPVLAGERRT